MKKLLFLVPLLLSLSSCAYVQTHKNVEERFVQRAGDELASPLQLAKVGATWYLCAAPCDAGLVLQHPVIHDEVFFNENNEPVLKAKEPGRGRGVFSAWPISEGTATVLMRADGYATLEMLAHEMKSHSGERLEKLPKHAVRYPIRAEIVGTENAICLPSSPAQQNMAWYEKALVQSDRVFVDWPLTLGYNCAIPFMAPVVFFYRFLNEE